MHDLDQVGLRGDHRVNVLVGTRRFIDHARVLAALNALGRLDMILNGECLLGSATAHLAAGSVAAGMERIRVALAPDNVRTRAHTARDDAQVTLARTHSALAG